MAGVDAHGGHILQVGNSYFLYGDSYDCGFRLSDPATPWCGFDLYTSTDLRHWTDRGPVFDPAVFQSQCGHGRFGCFRVDVEHNPKTGQFVLWFNDPATSDGYQVLTSRFPTGPWVTQPLPRLAVKATWYGDEALYSRGADAWIAYTIIDGRYHDIAIQPLNASWTTGAGKAVKLDETFVEAPALFERQGEWYVLYSDPACPYCSGTATAYRTAHSPSGPWSKSQLISRNSCGGQPSFVSPIDNEWVYSSDLWDHGDYNEKAARIYLTPLQFTGRALTALSCRGASPPPS